MTELYWNTITPVMRSVWQGFSSSGISAEFYLAGGTSLSLQLGHRLSVDLDFFSQTQSDVPALIEPLRHALKDFSPTLSDSSWGNLVFLANNVRVGFYGYGYNLVKPLLKIDGFTLASVEDIGLMKLDALLGRANRKDFHDLYELCKQIPMRDLLNLAPQKYPDVRDFEAQVARHLAYFDRAEQESPVPLIKQVEWATVKEWFRQQARDIGNSWLK
ncbi:MAG: nucleotidyl transferase AbiEii/AbiGii toxin family protein [Anaerolineales bacterium]|jgi:hypothetical protein|nr:nucleotidyl transferase AbiEii/AbiGii toxin family protein [Anaerolineales bacterium]WKZ38921.1 MAG: nucleotidyl transferase AbiEii/AbiGii toxin family protein [Anaerolineales bacterium]